MTKTAEYFENMFSNIENDGDSWGHHWRASQYIRHQTYLKTFDKYLNGNTPQKVLDLGTGQADILSTLQRRYPQHQYFGTDISNTAVSWCQKNLPHHQF